MAYYQSSFSFNESFCPFSWKWSFLLEKNVSWCICHALNLNKTWRYFLFFHLLYFQKNLVISVIFILIQAIFQMCCCLSLMEKKTLNFKRQHQVTKSYFTPSWNYSNTSYHFKKKCIFMIFRIEIQKYGMLHRIFNLKLMNIWQQLIL